MSCDIYRFGNVVLTFNLFLYVAVFPGLCLFFFFFFFSLSRSLDLLDQVKGLDANGQFRFTPPTHAIVAFHAALGELFEEGGVQARYERYEANRRVLGEFIYFILFFSSSTFLPSIHLQPLQLKCV